MAAPSAQGGSARRFPALRALGGLLFVLSGIAYYFGITVGSAAALIFVIAGAGVVALALSGRRARGSDVAIFVVALFVLAASVTPGVATSSSQPSAVTFSAPRSAASSERVELVATSDVGSISVSYTNTSSVAYQVNFTRSPLAFGFFSATTPRASLTNETAGGTLVLNATARGYGISVLIGTGYVLNVTATTGTGSLDLAGTAGQRLGDISLQSGTGSVTADLTSLSVGSIRLEAGTGSVALRSNRLAPDGARLPLTLTTGTGSVSLDVKLVNGTAFSVDATAGFGAISHNLPGFVVSPQSTRTELMAEAGDTATAPASFIARISTGTGSVTVDAQLMG